MIAIIFKSTIAFSLSFLVLSFHIGNKSIFDHITNITGPIGHDIQELISNSFDRSVKRSKNMITKAKKESKYVIDEVETSYSAIETIKTKAEKTAEAFEQIRQEEVQKLDELIKKNK